MTTHTSRWAWAASATRLAAGITAALVLVQGALAGGLLGGSSGARDLHRAIGDQLAWVALVVLILAVVAWRPGGRHIAPAVMALVGTLAMGAQIGMGFSGRVEGHVPLGIALFGLYLVLAVRPPRQMEVSS